MKSNKAKGIEKWGPMSLVLLYIFSWIGLICGISVAFYYFMEKVYGASLLTFLISITSWVSLTAFVYLTKVIIEIRDNIANLQIHK